METAGELNQDVLVTHRSRKRPLYQTTPCPARPRATSTLYATPMRAARGRRSAGAMRSRASIWPARSTTWYNPNYSLGLGIVYLTVDAMRLAYNVAPAGRRWMPSSQNSSGRPRLIEFQSATRALG